MVLFLSRLRLNTYCFFEEFGLGAIQTHRRYPAAESMPEVAQFPEDVQRKFFGSLDYAITGSKL